MQITINTDFIKLQQLLKLANIAVQGSYAKLIILNGDVTVNGNVCMQRGKKIKDGDIVFVKDFGTIKVIGEKYVR